MSNRYPGGFITADSPTVNTGEADGIWTLEQQANYQGQGTWPRPFYPIERSLRFNSADSAYLSWTPASAGNRKTWTWSGWVKRSGLTAFNTLFQANHSSTPWFVLGFANNDKIEVTQTAGSSASWETTALFRDVSAWYHVVLAVDTTSATSTMAGSATDRFRLYVNGTQYVISGGSVPSQNADLQVNNTVAHTIGGYGSAYSNQYLTEVHFIDGQALDPSSFGATNANTGVWSPIAYTGTYGQNGFYLPFNDNSSTEALGLNGFPVDAGATPTLLLNTNGVDADQNNTFLDSSTNAFTITRNGNTTQGTFSPFAKADGEWSSSHDGSGDFFNISNNAAIDVGTGAFTVEAWINPKTVEFNIMGSSANGGGFFGCTNGASYGIGIGQVNVSWQITSSKFPTLNVWNHIVYCRDSSNNVAIFLNGNRIASTVSSTNYGLNGGSLNVGGQANASTLNGNLSNFRLIKGSALYDPTQASLTVPTEPLTAIANTSLLTCQSNRFVDNSTNNFSLTVNGTPYVQPFSPFIPSSAYSASVNGGSGYFDGTTDYLSLATNAPFNFGTNDFTIEWWQNTTDTEYGVIHTGSGGWGIVITGGTLYFQSVIDSTNLLSASLTNYLKDQWVHFALVRNSGTLYLYINGVQITSAAYSTNISLTPTTSYVGYYISASRYLLGYFAGLRVVNGTAVYTSAFTPPTTPPTAIANTSLLLNFTNAGIYDATGDNSFETIGDAQVDTAVTKFGSSVKFDGASDYLKAKNSRLFDLGSGDFTLEFWAYHNNITSPVYQMYCGQFNSGGTTPGWNIYKYTNGSVQFYGPSGTPTLTSSNVMTAGNWYHIAVTRSGSTMRLFIDGVQEASTTNASFTDETTNSFYVGARSDVIGTYDMNGYIEDLRISKGIARYTGPFTPPTAAFTYPQADDNVYQYLWTPNNFSVTAGAGNDSLVDVPTQYGVDTGAGGEVRGNYCTLNPLDNGGLTLNNGNISASRASAAWVSCRATMGMTTGKWYWEYSNLYVTSLNWAIPGISTQAASLSQNIGTATNSWAYYYDGTSNTGGTASAYGATWNGSDVIGVSFDADAGTLVFYKNGVSQGTAFSGLTSGPYFPALAMYGTLTSNINFGQRPFAYTAPSGFKALCTTNLPTPTLLQGDQYFNTVTYTGTGATQSITGVGFQPDFVWFKARNVARSHRLVDAVRGVQKDLFSDTTGAENTPSLGLLSFDSDGFTVGGAAGYNANTETQVAWNWKANGAGSSNTDGSITSTVSVNQTAGFSVVTYTGNSGNAAATIGHGLGVAPSMMILKFRNTTSAWSIYHASLGNTQRLTLNTTDAATTDSTYWNNTSPTSTVFTVGSSFNQATAYDYVVYCFAEIPGYSAFGSYLGSTNLPFVYTGFRPSFILIKPTDLASNWYIYDDARSPYNIADERLFPDTSGTETTTAGNDIDFLSNGVKIRGSSTSGTNYSGKTFIYMAFAENPFKYSLGR